MSQIKKTLRWRTEKLPGNWPRPYVVVRTLAWCGALVTEVEPHVDATGRLIHFASQYAALATARRINREHDEQRGIFTEPERLL